MRTLTLPALAAAAWLAACASAPPPVEQTVACSAPTTARGTPAGPALVSQEYGTTITPIPLNAVLFTDEALARRVAVQALYSVRTETGTVQVSARLVHCGERQATLRARTSFMTKNGAPAEPPSAWQPVVLAPKATALYSERSLMREEVGTYLIEVAPLP